MSVFSRNKGNREERAIVNLHKDHGFEAKRVPLSGSMVGYKGDLVIHGLIGEAKLRATGFRTIYAWLADNDFLTIRNNKSERLYVIKEDRWLAMLKDHVNRPVDVEAAARKAGAV